METPQFYTITEVAEIVRVHRRQVYSYINSGALRAYRLGGRGDWRIPHESIKEFLRISMKPVERDGYE